MERLLLEAEAGISRHPRAIYHSVSSSNVSIVKKGDLMVAAVLISKSINLKKAALLNSFCSGGYLALFRFLSVFLCKHKLAVIEQTVAFVRLNACCCVPNTSQLWLIDIFRVFFFYFAVDLTVFCCHYFKPLTSVICICLSLELISHCS